MDLFRTEERKVVNSYSGYVTKETTFGKWFVGKPVILYWLAVWVATVTVTISLLLVWPIYVLRLIFKKKQPINETFVD
jgi:hypothetical protein